MPCKAAGLWQGSSTYCTVAVLGNGQLQRVLAGCARTQQHTKMLVQLLDLLDYCLLENEVVLLAAPALARILISKPEVSVDTLERSAALSLLAAAIKGQSRAAEGSQQQVGM